MALMEDIFAENILDEPDDLERIEENEILSGPEGNNSNDEDEEKKKDEGGDTGKKKRKPSNRPTLNSLRLMSEKNGLTTLEEVFKDVKFKGKGYEREDLNMIMRKMEIWTHKLFPSMQFDDCLAKLEKLGTTRPVMTYVKKIRLDMAVPRVGDEIDDKDDSGNELQPESSMSDFDKLLNSQNRTDETQINNTGVSSGLTTEQRERMMKNRLIAEQRRLARMKAREEQQKMQESGSKDEINEVQLESVNNSVTVNSDCVESSAANYNDVNSVAINSNVMNEENVMEGINDNMEVAICDSTEVNPNNNTADLTEETDNNMEVTNCDSTAVMVPNRECKITENTADLTVEIEGTTEGIDCESTAINPKDSPVKEIIDEIDNNMDVTICDSTETINPKDKIAEPGLNVEIEGNIQVTKSGFNVENKAEKITKNSIVNNTEEVTTNSDSKQLEIESRENLVDLSEVESPILN